MAPLGGFAVFKCRCPKKTVQNEEKREEKLWERAWQLNINGSKKKLELFRLMDIIFSSWSTCFITSRGHTREIIRVRLWETGWGPCSYWGKKRGASNFLPFASRKHEIFRRILLPSPLRCIGTLSIVHVDRFLLISLSLKLFLSLLIFI